MASDRVASEFGIDIDFPTLTRVLFAGANGWNGSPSNSDNGEDCNGGGVFI